MGKARGDRRKAMRVSDEIHLLTKCLECNRVFDLMNETDMDEYACGHDCEAE